MVFAQKTVDGWDFTSETILNFFYSSDLVVQVVAYEHTTKHTHAHTRHTPTHTTKVYARLEPYTTIHIRLQDIYEDTA
jgi:hypothetical protein